MEETTTDGASGIPAQSTPPLSAVRMIVLSNNKIFSSVMRAASLVLMLALALQFLRPIIPAGPFKGVVQSFDIALFAVGVGLFILEIFLERALRRCPVCSTYISGKTEEKRRCLECDTELWGN